MTSENSPPTQPLPEEAVEHMRNVLKALQLDCHGDPEMLRTPERFTQMLHEVFAGLREPLPKLSTFPNQADPRTQDPVLISALGFRSFCVHHLLPFFGTIDIAFVPGDTLLGFGSAGRLVDHFAAQPQVQERMVQQIGRTLEEGLQPKGVLIRCRARQMCMEMRGSKKRGVTVSMYSSGVLAQGEWRAEAMRQFEQQDEAL